jgi:hypothetical protein
MEQESVDIVIADPVQVRAIVEEIRNAHGDMDTNKVFFKNKYPQFAEDYPKLFKAVLDPNFPLSYLDMMLAQLEQLRSNSVTLDDADNNIYTKLREDYVEPLLSKPT